VGKSIFAGQGSFALKTTVSVLTWAVLAAGRFLKQE